MTRDWNPARNAAFAGGPETTREPSASFVLSLLEAAGVQLHPGFADALTDLHWQRFSAAVKGLAATIPKLDQPGDLSRKFQRHAQTETVGAEVIGYVAATVADRRHRGALLRHAADERRHCRIFSALSEVSGGKQPGAEVAEPSERDSFTDSYDGDLPSFLCDTLFAELRNVFYLSALFERVAHPAPSAQRKIQGGISRVIADEKRHVFGSAMILNDLFPADPLMPDRLAAGLDGYVAFIDQEAEHAASAI
ncbi:MAG: hypothetical protein QOK17_2167 [Sphingomonadales bacterium]|jgi:hypothetical protein|nr:hypothetical protein [Sphingomonadales bacterium]